MATGAEHGHQVCQHLLRVAGGFDEDEKTDVDYVIFSNPLSWDWLKHVELV